MLEAPSQPGQTSAVGTGKSLARQHRYDMTSRHNETLALLGATPPATPAPCCCCGTTRAAPQRAPSRSAPPSSPHRAGRPRVPQLPAQPELRAAGAGGQAAAGPAGGGGQAAAHHHMGARHIPGAVRQVAVRAGVRRQPATGCSRGALPAPGAALGPEHRAWPSRSRAHRLAPASLSGGCLLGALPPLQQALSVRPPSRHQAVPIPPRLACPRKPCRSPALETPSCEGPTLPPCAFLA